MWVAVASKQDMAIVWNIMILYIFTKVLFSILNIDFLDSTPEWFIDMLDSNFESENLLFFTGMDLSEVSEVFNGFELALLDIDVLFAFSGSYISFKKSSNFYILSDVI